MLLIRLPVSLYISIQRILPFVPVKKKNAPRIIKQERRPGIFSPALIRADSHSGKRLHGNKMESPFIQRFVK